ncbi:MAG TPA: hypothetical protein VMK82_03240 [Steroidobacteraceae bacterium]|nr:hypothetical protein [Steroidobacteraceae bacterium]
MRNVKSVTFALLLGACLWLAASPSLQAAGGVAQQRVAEEFLTALARGDAQALSMSILEDELVALRKGLLDQMKLEADRDDSLTRQRLFGDGMQLADIERLTPQNFFVALSQRLRFSGREFRKVDWLEVVKDRGGMVHLVGRLVPREDMGEVRVPVLVSLVPWGKDWKAALPLDLQAQIDDLRTGRTRAARPVTAVAATPTTGTGSSATPPANATPQPILELFDKALENLAAKRCEAYYDKQMSPNFRRTTGSRALRTLINACESRDTLREQYMTAIRLAREREPRFEYAGTRAVFDLAGTGLPYSRWIVEQVNERWYIAE